MADSIFTMKRPTFKLRYQNFCHPSRQAVFGVLMVGPNRWFEIDAYSLFYSDYWLNGFDLRDVRRIAYAAVSEDLAAEAAELVLDQKI